MVKIKELPDLEKLNKEQLRALIISKQGVIKRIAKANESKYGLLQGVKKRVRRLKKDADMLNDYFDCINRFNLRKPHERGK